MAIERNQFIFLLFVNAKLLLELSWIASSLEGGASAVIAGVALRHKLFNTYAMLVRNDVIFVVLAVAVGALYL